MGSIPITVSDVVRETTLNFTVDILSSGFSCVVFKILDKSKKEGRVMEKILSIIVILIVQHQQPPVSKVEYRPNLLTF